MIIENLDEFMGKNGELKAKLIEVQAYCVKVKSAQEVGVLDPDEYTPVLNSQLGTLTSQANTLWNELKAIYQATNPI